MATRPGTISEAGTTPKIWLAKGNDSAFCWLDGAESNRMLSSRTEPPAGAFMSLLTMVKRKWTWERSVEVRPRAARSKHIGVHWAGMLTKGVGRLLTELYFEAGSRRDGRGSI